MRHIIFLVFVFCSQSVWAGCYVNEQTDEENFVNCKADAEQGDSDAQYIVANMYNSGLGVDKDEKQAVSWYQKSADQNNDLAQYGLGVMHEFGLGGLKQDADEAYKWYQRAAGNGNYFAQNKLGIVELKEDTYKRDVMPDTAESESYSSDDNDNIFERFWDWLLGIKK